ncbi:FmdB family zinc ribbon protein [Nocardioides sp.]|uniref:FmdB family zinc ribbon protein n=1 Tax=Nocardioides sp. TaxID=35761 RepID=UPI0031FEB1CF|nr:FmdB family transcriptional regulator [Nocardioides sp.]
MPTYQYACTECEHAFDQFQSFSDDALTDCPECTGRLRKVFNAVGVVFKGSGFYRTDSRAATSAATPAASSEGGSSSEGGATKTETKPESKPDAKPAAANTSKPAPAASSNGSSSTSAQ